MLHIIIENGAPTVDYCMRLLRCGPNELTQFIDVLIETRQNYIIYMFFNTTSKHASF